MSFEKLLGATLALYILLNFIVLPRLTKSWKASRQLSKLGKAGLLSGLQACRDLALIASIMYLLFALLTMTLSFGYGRNTAILALMVGCAERVHNALKGVKSVVDSYYFLIPAGLVVYFSWRRQRSEFSARCRRFLEDEYDRLNREREKGEEWDNLDPDDRMRALDSEIARLEKEISQLGQEDRELRQSMRQRMVRLREQRNEADYDRRIRIDKLAEDQDAETVGWRGILLSKGLFSDLKGATKLLSRATTAVLSIALIGVASTAGLTATLWNQVVTLDELRVETTKEKVDKEWKERTASAATQPLAEDDQRAITEMANTFARALTQNRNWRPLSQNVSEAQEMGQRLARRAILDSVRLPTKEGRPTAAFVDDLPATHREILEEVTRESAPESRVGRIVADREGPRIKSFFGSKWNGVKASVLEHAKTYHQPVKINDLESSLVDRIVSAAFDGVVPDADSEIIKQARSAMSSATKKAVNEAVTTEFHKVMEDLAKGELYSERIAKVATEDIPVGKGNRQKIVALIHERRMPDLTELNRQARESSGTWVPPEGPQSPRNAGDRLLHGNGNNWASSTMASGNGAVDGEADSVIRDIAARATRNGQYSLTEESIDALAQYEDHFPRSIAAQSRTPLSRALKHFRLATDAAQFERITALKVLRAGNFAMLRGFSRVGGVLIGEDPENPKTKLDIRNLTWRIDGRNVTLLLTDVSGHAQEFGPFDRSLVHQALGYAADGRPVAVTMTKARPLRQLKIHLNPSLVDTPLGCRVTQIDRLVDTYANQQLPQRGEMTERYSEQFAVYNLTWSKRLGALAALVGKGTGLQEEAKAKLEANREAAQRGLQQSGLFGKDSVLRRKPEFFDPEVVSVAEACLNRNREAFENCALSYFESARALKKGDINILEHWVQGYATFEAWSGVRERKFRTTSDLAFLRQPDGTSTRDRLWPFDFIVQIAFTSAPVNLPQKEIANYVDTRPIEFVELQPKIEQLVAAGVDQSRFRAAFEDVQRFAVLQRLFRSALRGNLGDQFPLEQLGRLTAATTGGIPYFHTSRWNGSTAEQLEFNLSQAEAANGAAAWMKSAAEQAKRCRSALASVRANGAALGSACDFSAFRKQAEQFCPDGAKGASCTWKYLSQAGVSVPITVQQEISFGVLEDRRASSPGVECPPLAPRTSAGALALTR